MLTQITIAGTMQGTAWGSLLGDDTADIDIDFSQAFTPPGRPHSPWNPDWRDIRTALESATTSGDLIGGMGRIVYAVIIFEYAKCNEIRRVWHTLQPGRNTADFWE